MADGGGSDDDSLGRTESGRKIMSPSMARIRPSISPTTDGRCLVESIQQVRPRRRQQSLTRRRAGRREVQYDRVRTQWLVLGLLVVCWCVCVCCPRLLFRVEPIIAPRSVSLRGNR